MRNNVSKLIISSIVLAFLLLTSSYSSVSAMTSEDKRVAKLIEGAKKEGKMVYYTAMSITEAVPLLRKFEKKYPFIKAELFRGRGEKQVLRLIAETRAGKHIADAIRLGGFQMHLVKKEGILMKYLSPERRAYPTGFKDPEGYWTDTFLNTHVIVYNTKLVSAKDAPRSYEDLLDPKWKGKLGMDYQEYEWFNCQLKIMGEEKGIEFMKKLAKQNINFRNGRTLITQLVTAGEFHAAVNVYAGRVENFMAKGAPIKWVADEPVVAKLHPLAVSAYAPHRNAAKLFVDFFLSKEGQNLIRDFGDVPSRPDVEPNPPRLTKGLKLFPSDPKGAENYNDIVRRYNTIFGIKK